MPDPQKLTVQQFAQRIKTKYPQYASVSDEKVAHAFVTKYPQYAAQVELGAGAKREATPHTQPLATVGATSATGKAPEEWHPQHPEKYDHGAYAVADKLLPLLPGAGATAGGMLASETGPGAIPAAALGAGVGEGVREQLTRAIFGGDPEHMAALPQDAKGKALAIGGQAALGGVAEGATVGAKAVLSRLAAPFLKASSTIEKAKAGEGIRMTPGEAAGSSGAKKIESAVGHLPGGMGTMERFREQQAEDAAHLFARRIHDLHSSNPFDSNTSEEVGQAVKDFVGESGEHVDRAHAAQFAQNVKELGLEDVNHEQIGKGAQQAVQSKWRDMEIEETRLYDLAKKEAGVDGEFLKPKELQQAVTDRELGHEELLAARRYTLANRAAFQNKLVAAVRNTAKPEAIPALIEKASLGDVRALHSMLPPEAQGRIAQSTLARLTAESTDADGQLSAKRLTLAMRNLGDDKGKLIFGADRWQQLNGTIGKMRELETNLPQARTVFQSDLMHKIATSGKPEAVAALFEKGPAADLRSLMGAMPEPLRNRVSADVLHGIVGRSIDAQTGRLTAKPIAEALADLGEGRGRIIFGKQWEAIKEASRLMDKIKGQEGGAAGQMHAFRYAASMIGAAGTLGFATGHTAAMLGAAGGEMLAARAITEALTNPQLTVRTLNALRIAATMAARGVPYAAGEMRDTRVSTPYQDYRDAQFSPPSQ